MNTWQTRADEKIAAATRDGVVWCTKGLCERPATRIAQFVVSGMLTTVPVEQVACDRCGAATVVELPQAAEVRTWCPCCFVKPGNAHGRACDIARCMLCGGQAISCHECAFGAAGVAVDDSDEEDPTEAEWAAYDAAVAKIGGPDVWDGEYPGTRECREFGWYAVETAERRFVRCESDAPGAREDLDRLRIEARWDRNARRWVQATTEGARSSGVASLITRRI